MAPGILNVDAYRSRRLATADIETREDHMPGLYSYDQQTHYQFTDPHHHTSNAVPGLRAPVYRSDVGALISYDPRGDVLDQGQPFGRPNAASSAHSYVASTAMQSPPVQVQPPPIFLDQRPQSQLGPGAGTLPTYQFDGSQHHLTSNAAPGLSAPMYLSADAALTVFNPIHPASDILSRGQPGGCQDAASFGHAWASTVMENPPVQGQPLPMTQVNYNENGGDHYQSLNYHYRLQQNDNLVFNNAFVFDNSAISDFGTVLNGPVYPSNEARKLVTQTSGYSGTTYATGTSWTPEVMRGLPPQRHRPSVMQASDGDRNGVASHQQPQVAYNQPYSNAPIFNGPVYGPVQNSSQIVTFDGLQFLYQHAAMGAIHESEERFPPPLCHPGTRDVVIGRVIGWYLDRNGKKKGIMWIHAPAGYGKTAVAGSVKERLDVMELEFACPVGATFFFWRSSPERNSPARFIITLAYQLTQSTPELRVGIEATIKSKPGIVKMTLEDQLMELIVKPFRSLSNLDSMPNRLIIVDGIDECINSDRQSLVEKKYAEDQERVQIRVLRLIHCLQSHHLPLSFLILSRPEAWIKRHFESEPYCDVVETLDLYEVGDHMNDVKQFVRAELSRIADSFGLEGVDEEWTDDQSGRLALDSGPFDPCTREFLEDPQLSFEFAVDLRKGRERMLSNVLDRMSSITTDTIGNELEDADVFALDNWCDLWDKIKDTFSESRETCIDMMKKISALDFTACIIQYYHYSTFPKRYSSYDNAMDLLLKGRQLSDFFVPSMELDRCPDILPVVRMVTSHIQASLDHLLILLLKSSTFPKFSAHATYMMASVCAGCLSHAMYQPNWRENKIIQALRHPGPDGIGFLKEVVDLISSEIRGGYSGLNWDLLDHIYEVMVQEENPILKVKDNPFRKYLRRRNQGRRRKDEPRFTESSDSDEE